MVWNAIQYDAIIKGVSFLQDPRNIHPYLVYGDEIWDVRCEINACLMFWCCVCISVCNIYIIYPAIADPTVYRSYMQDEKYFPNVWRTK